MDSTHGVRIACAAPRASYLQLAATQVPNLGLLAALLDAIHNGQTPQTPLQLLGPEDVQRPVLADGLEDPGCDPHDLLVAGYDWDDIQRMLRAECSLDELLARGPRHRPRHPR